MHLKLHSTSFQSPSPWNYLISSCIVCMPQPLSPTHYHFFLGAYVFMHHIKSCWKEWPCIGFLQQSLQHRQSHKRLILYISSSFGPCHGWTNNNNNSISWLCSKIGSPLCSRRLATRIHVIHIRTSSFKAMVCLQQATNESPPLSQDSKFKIGLWCTPYSCPCAACPPWHSMWIYAWCYLLMGEKCVLT
jgi:hypothetical protein